MKFFGRNLNLGSSVQKQRGGEWELWEDPRVSFELAGFFNVDAAQMSVAGKFLSKCEECNGFSLTSLQHACEYCGRDPDNYLSLRSGNGDGVYPVFNLLFDRQVIGAVAVLDSDFARGISDEFTDCLDGKRKEFLPHLSLLKYLSRNASPEFLYKCGEIQVVPSEVDNSAPGSHRGNLIYAAANEGVDSNECVISIKVPAGSYEIIALIDDSDLSLPIVRVVIATNSEIPQKNNMGLWAKALDWGSALTAWENATVATALYSTREHAFILNYYSLFALSYSSLISDSAKAEIWAQALSWIVVKVLDTGVRDEMTEAAFTIDLQAAIYLLGLRGRFKSAGEMRSWPPLTVG